MGSKPHTVFKRSPIEREPRRWALGEVGAEHMRARVLAQWPFQPDRRPVINSEKRADPQARAPPILSPRHSALVGGRRQLFRGANLSIT